jgi:hypothetical protein
MNTIVSFLIIFSLIYSYLIFYHKIDFVNFLDVMHSAFTRQFIFELIPFIILFSTRELKFIDIDSAANFFNSVIGRSMIGMIAFTFATYTLSTVNPMKIGAAILDPVQTIRLNSFANQQGVSLTNQQVGAPLANQQVGAPLANQQVGAPLANQQVGAPLANQQDVSLTNQQISAPFVNQQVGAPLVNQQVGAQQGGGAIKHTIEPNEKLLLYALI